MNKIIMAVALLLSCVPAFCDIFQNAYTTTNTAAVDAHVLALDTNAPPLPANVVTNGSAPVVLGPNNHANGNILELVPNINTANTFQVDYLGTQLPAFSVDPDGNLWGNGFGLTNLNGANIVGSINAPLLTNPPAYLNDFLTTTNPAFLPFSASAQVQNISTISNATVLLIGDSMTTGQGAYSASSFLGDLLIGMFGDAGGNFTDFNVPGAGNWGNYPTQLNRYNAFIGYWFASGAGIEYAADGTNAFQSQQGAGSSFNARQTFPTAIGVSYLTQPLGGNFTLQISSVLAASTNYLTVNGLSATTNYCQTNIVVPAGANDWRIYVTTLVGTNWLLSANYLSTNAGYQVWMEASGSITLSNMLNCGTNNFAAMLSSVNPQLIIYHAKDIAENGTGSIMTNLLYQFLQYAPSNCQITIVGTPPVQGATYDDQNFYYKEACQQFGWYYLNLHDDFPIFQQNTNAGLMGDGTHPNNNGAAAWGADLFRLLGFNAQTKTVLAASLVGRIGLNALPTAAITNNEVGATLSSLTVNGSGGFNAAIATITSFGYLEGPMYMDSGQNSVLGTSASGVMNIGSYYSTILGVNTARNFSSAPYNMNWAGLIVTNASLTVPSLGISEPLNATGDLIQGKLGSAIVFEVGSNGIVSGNGFGLTNLGTSGIIQLASGTQTVSTTAASYTARIQLTYISKDGTVASLYYKTNEITPGSSFIIRSSNVADTNNVNWMILK